MRAGNDWPIGARLAWSREWRSPFGLQASGTFANAGEQFRQVVDVFEASFSHSYDDWVIESSADAGHTGIWDVCPDDLVTGVTSVIWNEAPSSFDPGTSPGILLPRRPRSDDESLAALTPPERWIAARLLASTFFQTVSLPLTPAAEELAFTEGDFSDPKSFKDLTKRLSSAASRGQEASGADLGTVLMVHAIAQELVPPLTGTRVLGQSFAPSRREALTVGSAHTPYFIRQEVGGLEPVGVDGTELSASEEKTLANNVVFLCRNWSGSRALWVPGGWSPGVHKLLTELTV